MCLSSGGTADNWLPLQLLHGAQFTGIARLHSLLLCRLSSKAEGGQQEKQGCLVGRPHSELWSQFKTPARLRP